MIDIKKAFSYPFEDDQWKKKIAIGTVIMIVFGLPRSFIVQNVFNVLISFNTINIIKALIALIFLVPAILCLGYLYATFKRVLNNDKPYMPEWSDFRELFFLGLKAFIVILIFYSIPFVLFQIGMYLMHYGLVNDNYALFGVLASAFYYGAGIIVLFVMLILPMAMANYAKSDESFKAVFAFSDILKKIVTVFGDYFVVFVICLLFFFFFKLLPIIGIFFLFYITLVLVGLTGIACSGAFKETEVPSNINSNETK
jgi:Protein of unknown function (DUF4013)